MGVAEFIKELRDLGYDVVERNDNKVEFHYTIPCGRFIGQAVKLGFEIPPDFPLSPPSGPHISPHLLPLNPNAPGHPERVADSSFGQEWQYWSRPFNIWANTNRSLKTYMGHIRLLFDTQ